MQRLDPARTTWHITFGTYGTRLHGDGRPTVDQKSNDRGDPFIYHDHDRADFERDRMIGDPIYLAAPQRSFIEGVIPGICERGDWTYRMCAAPLEADHVHVLLDALPSAAPKAIRKWLKRWISDELTQRWGKPVSGRWWAKGGSTRAVRNEPYLNRAYPYIRDQRTMPHRD